MQSYAARFGSAEDARCARRPYPAPMSRIRNPSIAAQAHPAVEVVELVDTVEQVAADHRALAVAEGPGSEELVLLQPLEQAELVARLDVEQGEVHAGTGSGAQLAELPDVGVVPAEPGERQVLLQPAGAPLRVHARGRVELVVGGLQGHQFRVVGSQRRFSPRRKRDGVVVGGVHVAPRLVVEPAHGEAEVGEGHPDSLLGPVRDHRGARASGKELAGHGLRSYLGAGGGARLPAGGPSAGRRSRTEAPCHRAAKLKYGQNLVELARLLAETAPLTVMDIGAQRGDSALRPARAGPRRSLERMPSAALTGVSGCSSCLRFGRRSMPTSGRRPGGTAAG